MIRRTFITVRGHGRTHLKFDTVTGEVFAFRRNLLGPADEVQTSFLQRKDGRYELRFAQPIGGTLRTLLATDDAELLLRYIGTTPQPAAATIFPKITPPKIGFRPR